MGQEKQFNNTLRVRFHLLVVPRDRYFFPAPQFSTRIVIVRAAQSRVPAATNAIKIKKE